MIQHLDYTLVVDLVDEGIAFEDMSLFIKKPDQTTFDELTLDALNFFEAALGYYNISIPKAQTDELGTYVFRVVGYELDLFIEKENLPQPLSSVPAPDVCVVSGNVRDVAAQIDSFKNVEVIARPLKLPSEVGGSLITGSNIVTRTDHDGFFSIPLIIGMTVLIEIKAAGVRFTAEIPDQPTIRIEDLMP